MGVWIRRRACRRRAERAACGTTISESLARHVADTRAGWSRMDLIFIFFSGKSSPFPVTVVWIDSADWGWGARTFCSGRSGPHGESGARQLPEMMFEVDESSLDWYWDWDCGPFSLALTCIGRMKCGGGASFRVVLFFVSFELD